MNGMRLVFQEKYQPRKTRPNALEKQSIGYFPDRMVIYNGGFWGQRWVNDQRGTMPRHQAVEATPPFVYMKLGNRCVCTGNKRRLADNVKKAVRQSLKELRRGTI